MPRRHRIPLLAFALVMGLLLALGVAACGDAGSQSAETLETPPLTVGAGATLPSTTASTTTTTSTITTDGSADTGGGAADTGGDAGGTVDTGGGTAGGDTGGTTGGDTGGGTTPPTGGGTTTPTQPANPGGASPNYQSFCNENPGAC